MRIDITQPVLDSEAIAQKRAKISTELEGLDRKQKWVRLGAVLVSIGVFVIMIVVNALFGLPTLVDLFVATICGVTTLSTITALFFADTDNDVLSEAADSAIYVISAVAIASISIAVGSAYFVTATAVVTERTAVSVIALGVTAVYTFVTLALIYHLNAIKNTTTFLESSLSCFGDADPESCLEIKNWLSDEVIANFHQCVLAKSRRFTVGETEAMRQFWDERARIAKDADRKNEIEAACREVYIEPLVND